MFRAHKTVSMCRAFDRYHFFSNVDSGEVDYFFQLAFATVELSLQHANFSFETIYVTRYNRFPTQKETLWLGGTGTTCLMLLGQYSPHTIWLHTILYYTILYYTILYYTILYYTILYYTIRHDTIRYYTIQYYTILDQTRLYYSIR